jgi:hypothetical protein
MSDSFTERQRLGRTRTRIPRDKALRAAVMLTPLGALVSPIT